MTYDLCVVTDAALARGRSQLEIVRAAIKGGATLIQFREKKGGTRELLETGEALRAATREAGVPLIVNDRLDVALAVDADGAHVGQDDMPAALARRLIGPDGILGVSAASLGEALKAEREGADYLGVGPIFHTGSKADAAPPMGLSGLSAVAARVHIPVVAIGGVGPENVEAVVEAGADGAAVVSAVVGADDVEQAARLLRVRVRDAKARRSGATR